MSEVTLKKGLQVRARTLRGSDTKDGKIIGVEDTAKGKWYTVRPDDGSNDFKTRAGCITPA